MSKLQLMPFLLRTGQCLKCNQKQLHLTSRY